MNWIEARMLAARDAKFRAKLNALLAERRREVIESVMQLPRLQTATQTNC